MKIYNNGRIWLQGANCKLPKWSSMWKVRERKREERERGIEDEFREEGEVFIC